MSAPFCPACLLPLLALPVAADAALTLPGAAAGGDAPAAAIAPVADDSALEAEQPPLSEGEARIRAGIVLQGRLLTLLAHIEDHDSAEAAVAPLMRLIGEFQSWAQSFSTLPPLDDETRSLYERRYLPVISELNERIRAQGARLASAEFYGSSQLTAALARLVTSAL